MQREGGRRGKAVPLEALGAALSMSGQLPAHTHQAAAHSSHTKHILHVCAVNLQRAVREEEEEEEEL